MRLLILEREEGKEGERNIHQLPPIRALTRDHAPTVDPTCNLGMLPDWGSNPQLWYMP